jgi:hypothetical protein
MSKRTVVLSCLSLTITLAAAAKADVIENLVFTGTATCGDSNCANFGSGPLTGTYSLDVTAQSIVGSWSFSTPFGEVSSSDAGADGFVVDRFGDVNPEFTETTSTPLFFDFVQLFFPGTDTQEIGALDTTNAGSDACINIAGGVDGGPACDPDYVISGTTALAAAPEPSTQILLGVAMLGFVCWRTGTALKPKSTQSLDE